MNTMMNRDSPNRMGISRMSRRMMYLSTVSRFGETAVPGRGELSRGPNQRLGSWVQDPVSFQTRLKYSDWVGLGM